MQSMRTPNTDMSCHCQMVLSPIIYWHVNNYNYYILWIHPLLHHPHSILPCPSHLEHEPVLHIQHNLPFPVVSDEGVQHVWVGQPSITPEFRVTSNQLQVAQGQGLVRDCVFVQAAIGCCILPLLVPKMVLTLCNLHWWCFFPLPTRHLLMCTYAHMSTFCNLHCVVVVVVVVCGGDFTLCTVPSLSLSVCVCVCMCMCVWCGGVWLALCGSQCCHACLCYSHVHDGLLAHAITSVVQQFV